MKYMQTEIRDAEKYLDEPAYSPEKQKLMLQKSDGSSKKKKLRECSYPL